MCMTCKHMYIVSHGRDVTMSFQIKTLHYYIASNVLNNVLSKKPCITKYIVHKYLVCLLKNLSCLLWLNLRKYQWFRIDYPKPSYLLCRKLLYVKMCACYFMQNHSGDEFWCLPTFPPPTGTKMFMIINSLFSFP